MSILDLTKQVLVFWPLSQLEGLKLLFLPSKLVPVSGNTGYQGSQLCRGRYMKMYMSFQGGRKVVSFGSSPNYTVSQLL